MTIALVLKSGGVYTEDYVRALVNQLRYYGCYRDRIVCLTDLPLLSTEYDAIPLKRNAPSWWSKIELFTKGLFEGTVLYFDLDTLVIDEISELVELCEQHDKPLFLLGANVVAHEHQWLASGMMSWKGDVLYKIYEEFFSVGFDKIIDEARKLPAIAGQRGDQGFIRRILSRSQYDFFQDHLPDNYLQFKRHVHKDLQKAHDCRVINWSGEPRFHTKEFKYHIFWKSCLNILKSTGT